MNYKAKISSIIALLLLLVIVFFVACNDEGSKSKTKNKKTLDLPFSQKPVTDGKDSPLGSTTTRPIETSDATSKALRELPVLSAVDMYYPEMYLSARYEAIVNGSLDSHDDTASNYLYNKIAITELDDPSNSDLDAATFAQLRYLTISVAKAEATGEGVDLHPEYFTGFTEADSCVDFKVNAAGAISMPYPNDNTWALGIVNWSATCFPFGKDKESKLNTAQQTVYMHRVNNVWKAVPMLSIPRKSLDGFATP